MTTILETNFAVESGKESKNGQTDNASWNLARRADGRLVLQQENGNGERVENTGASGLLFPLEPAIRVYQPAR